MSHGSQSPVVLHQWEISPFCQKVARSLRRKGIGFQTVNYNGALAAKVGRLSKVGKLPVLDVDGQRVQDSTRIARWLDAHYPEPPLIPQDPQQRALVELWEDWADESLYWFQIYLRVSDPEALEAAVKLSYEGRPNTERLPTKLGYKTIFGLQLKAQGLGRQPREEVDAEFLRHLDRIDVVLGPTGFLVGDAVTLADLAVGSQLLEVDRTSGRMRPELRRRPNLAAWLEKIRAI
jgi:glutathione S-transferase